MRFKHKRKFYKAQIKKQIKVQANLKCESEKRIEQICECVIKNIITSTQGDDGP